MKQQKETFSAINLYKFALLALILGLNVSQPLLAAEMPCVKEVCIGDDLNKLRGIKFQPVDESRVAIVNKRKQTDRAEIYGKFDGSEVPASLILGKFDENTLDEMAKMSVACSPANGLEGTYISESGYKTNIHVALWPDSSGNMKWLVKSISRAYKGLQSRNETNRLIQGLREKYAKWDIAYLGQPKPGFAGMSLLPVREPILSLFYGTYPCGDSS